MRAMPLDQPSEHRARRNRRFWQGEGHPGHPGHETEDGSEYSEEEVEFIRAMEAYMRRTGRRFPKFTEVLGVAKSLGYRKVNGVPDGSAGGGSGVAV